MRSNKVPVEDESHKLLWADIGIYRQTGGVWCQERLDTM